MWFPSMNFLLCKKKSMKSLSNVYRWFWLYCWNWQHFSHSFGWSEKCKKRRGNCILILPFLLSTVISKETVLKYFRYRTTPKVKRERDEALFPLKQLTPAPSRIMSVIVSFSVKFFCCLPQRPFRSLVRLFRRHGYSYILFQVEQIRHFLKKCQKPKYSI